MQIKDRVTQYIYIDNTLSLRKDGYLFIKNRSKLCGLDVFEIHIMGKKDSIVLFEECNLLLTQVACRFAGVPLVKTEIRSRAEDFSMMVDGFGSMGPRNIKGQAARTRTEDWIRCIIENVRTGILTAKPDTALYTMAFHTELDGSLLEPQVAAVELINIIRPIVAIATTLPFAFLALHDHPYCKEKLASGESNYFEMFTQEVRRFYPFGPFTGAKVREDFTWNNYDFKQGTTALLDIYGINHDERIWENPDVFYPEHFKNWNKSLFNFIPQGGGDSTITHRCPGEGFTIEMMKIGLDYLVNKMEYKVPTQDLSYSLTRMPSLPESGFIMSNVKRKNQDNSVQI